MDNFQIGMAQLYVAKSPGRIRSTGLGSASELFCKTFAKVGEWPTMLPKHRPGRGDNKAKYVDTAIEIMLEDGSLGSEPHEHCCQACRGRRCSPTATKTV